MQFSIYRFDPDHDARPYMQDYELPEPQVEPGMMVKTRISSGMFSRRGGDESGDRLSFQIRGHDMEMASDLSMAVKEVMEGVPGVTDSRYFRERSIPAYGFSPFGEVIEGMEAVDSLYSGYGEGAPSGNGPSQGRIAREGKAYLEAEFPKLDVIISAEILS